MARKRKFVYPKKDVVVATIAPWLKGFIQKEYGKHTNPDDKADLEQEGYLSLLALLSKMESSTTRLSSEEEFYFYIKAVVRNAIRDYILKFRSRFGISLFKLRRELKGKDDTEHLEKRLGDFMHTVGEEFTYLAETESEDPEDYSRRQRRLSILSKAGKSCRELDIEQSQSLLMEVIGEYKKTELVDSPFEASAPPPVPVNPQVTPSTTSFVARTPIPNIQRSSKKCASLFCSIDLTTVKSPVVEKGFGYCSKKCKKEWPPVVNKIQSKYGNTPIEVVLAISLKLFRSKRRAAEVLNMGVSTFEKLAAKFKID